MFFGRNLFTSALLALAASAAVSGLELLTAHLTCASGIDGTVSFTVIADYHTEVSLNFKGLHKGEKYNYFVNQYPVPAGGDCTKTGVMYDPFLAFMDKANYKCKKNKPLPCAMGDLTGRAGKPLKGKGREGVSDIDAFDVVSDQGKYQFKGRSVVLFDGQGQLVACANIVAA
ncbi:hypothetical protein H4R33_004247 [Dimargaris cristalligena]|uniref:Superoxide dismutase n=1 Tax=Dimargaris cristalligena TaxID=215637 RepID=A0A4P9ZYV1_9FUNG|nr:hypothetical protein H4R33_004247 [Dimargaris cristalligena]RKP38251.1 superoxide dismutase [Dimargaris cristalligena]|eukprot:RKP38251.1 superoxide dismutase [Dimargaris cristalligena]